MPQWRHGRPRAGISVEPAPAIANAYEDAGGNPGVGEPRLRETDTSGSESRP